MALHHKIAQKALVLGKRSYNFSKAAQEHANVTWFLLILAGAVWYFFGWLWALIPAALGVYTTFLSISATMVSKRLEGKESNSGSSDTKFVEILQSYGKILETAAPAPGTVADVNKLPYTKQQIKKAIIAALRSTGDSQMKEHLKVAYIVLSNWQEGVGEVNRGLDVSALDMNQDAESLAKAVLEQSSGAEYWTAKAQKEQETLERELQELGLW